MYQSVFVRISDMPMQWVLWEASSGSKKPLQKPFKLRVHSLPKLRITFDIFFLQLSLRLQNYIRFFMSCTSAHAPGTNNCWSSSGVLITILI